MQQYICTVHLYHDTVQAVPPIMRIRAYNKVPREDLKIQRNPPLCMNFMLFANRNTPKYMRLLDKKSYYANRSLNTRHITYKVLLCRTENEIQARSLHTNVFSKKSRDMDSVVNRHFLACVLQMDHVVRPLSVKVYNRLYGVVHVVVAFFQASDCLGTFSGKSEKRKEQIILYNHPLTTGKLGSDRRGLRRSLYDATQPPTRPYNIGSNKYYKFAILDYCLLDSRAAKVPPRLVLVLQSTTCCA